MDDDNATWPDGFMDIGSKTFQYVYTHKPVFVDFTLKEMVNPTGLFQRWYQYCLNKQT